MIYSSIDSVSYYSLILALVVGFGIAFAVTPLIKRLAFRIGAVDIPKDNRRMHKKPMPLIGGLAIFLGFSVSAVVSRLVSVDTFRLQFLPLWCGAFLIVILGILDDIFELKPIVKFAGQFAAAAIPILRNITINNIFGIQIESRVLSVLITLIWIVGLTNAINLIDGLDGLACGVSSICCVILMVVSLLKSELYVTLLTAGLAGACLGFLPYNLNPASIFMGDTGSMFLGYTLAVTSIIGVFKLSAAVSFIIPIIVFGLPIFDTAFAIIRRVLSGRSPFSADRGHLHHKLVDHGFNVKQSVLILYAICSILGCFAIMVTESKFSSTLVIIIIALLIGLFNRVMTFLSDWREQKEQKKDKSETEQDTPAAPTAEQESAEQQAQDGEKSGKQESAADSSDEQTSDRADPSAPDTGN